jgi:hypothetical protein
MAGILSWVGEQGVKGFLKYNHLLTPLGRALEHRPVTSAVAITASISTAACTFSHRHHRHARTVLTPTNLANDASVGSVQQYTVQQYTVQPYTVK